MRNPNAESRHYFFIPLYCSETVIVMQKYIILLFLLFFSGPYLSFSQRARMLPEITPAGKGKVNTRIDNIGYWSRMIQLGYVKATPKTIVPPARFTGTTIKAYKSSIVSRQSSILQNSPDIPVTGETDVTQSENSIFIDPGDENVVLNSNNSSSWIAGYAETPYGADALYSTDDGQDWGGSTQGVNGNNAGDPATAIGLNGWWYVGRINGDICLAKNANWVDRVLTGYITIQIDLGCKIPGYCAGRILCGRRLRYDNPAIVTCTNNIQFTVRANGHAAPVRIVRNFGTVLKTGSTVDRTGKETRLAGTVVRGPR